MIWLTWWPLVLGFSLSGLVQSLIPRDALRAQLGETSPSFRCQGLSLGHAVLVVQLRRQRDVPRALRSGLVVV